MFSLTWNLKNKIRTRSKKKKKKKKKSKIKKKKKKKLVSWGEGGGRLGEIVERD